MDEMLRGSEKSTPELVRRMITMRIIFFAIQAGLWLFFAVMVYLRMTGAVVRSSDATMGKTMWIIGGVLTLAGVTTCIVLRKAAWPITAGAPDLESAVGRYFPLMLVALGTAEMAGFFQGISLLFSEQIELPILFFFICAGVAWIHYPSLSRIDRVYRHIREEIELFQKMGRYNR